MENENTQTKPAKNDEEKKGRKVRIIVNGQPEKVEEKEISFDEVVNLAFDGSPPAGPNVQITVTYRKANGNKEGSLVPGAKVKVKEGMIFNVTATDKS